MNPLSLKNPIALTSMARLVFLFPAGGLGVGGGDGGGGKQHYAFATKRGYSTNDDPKMTSRPCAQYYKTATLGIC